MDYACSTGIFRSLCSPCPSQVLSFSDLVLRFESPIRCKARFTMEPPSEKEVPSAPAKVQFPEMDLDKGIVGWEGQDDPANPQNFAPGKKWSLLALISALTIISPLASSMFAPAVSFMAEEFKVTNTTLLSFSVSIYLLGYTVSECMFCSYTWDRRENADGRRLSGIVRSVIAGPVERDLRPSDCA